MSQFLHDERTWGVLAGGAAIWILWSRDDQDQISVDASDRTVAVQAKSRAASPSSPSFPSSPNAGPHFDSVLVCPGMQGSAINSAGQFSASNPSIFVSNSVVEIVVSSVLRFFHFLHDTFKAAQKAAMLIVASRTPQKNLRQGRASLLRSVRVCSLIPDPPPRFIKSLEMISGQYRANMCDWSTGATGRGGTRTQACKNIAVLGEKTVSSTEVVGCFWGGWRQGVRESAGDGQKRFLAKKPLSLTSCVLARGEREETRGWGSVIGGNR
eukprot:473368-Rhodomonas_salina.3